MFGGKTWGGKMSIEQRKGREMFYVQRMDGKIFYWQRTGWVMFGVQGIGGKITSGQG